MNKKWLSLDMKVGQSDASLGGCSSVRMSEPWAETSFFTPSYSLPFLWSWSFNFPWTQRDLAHNSGLFPLSFGLFLLSTLVVLHSRGEQSLVSQWKHMWLFNMAGHTLLHPQGFPSWYGSWVSQSWVQILGSVSPPLFGCMTILFNFFFFKIF